MSTTGFEPRTSPRGKEYQKNKSFLLTIFNVELQQFHEFVNGLNLLRATYQLELCPTTNKQHIQAFLEFEIPISYKMLKAFPILSNSHLEGARCPKFAQAYCSKDDTRLEGPFQLGPAYILKKPTLKVIRELVIKGDLETIKKDYFGVFLRCRRAILDEISLHQPQETTTDTRGIWICGNPGVGKTFTVRSMEQGVYTKPPNKWWDSYNGEKIVLADDWDEDQSKWCAHYLKIWTDKYPFIAEIKGGAIRPLYDWFIVTSNLSIDEFCREYTNIKTDAIKRRFKQFDFNTTEGKQHFIDMFNL